MTVNVGKVRSSRAEGSSTVAYVYWYIWGASFMAVGISCMTVGISCVAACRDERNRMPANCVGAFPNLVEIRTNMG